MFAHHGRPVPQPTNPTLQSWDLQQTAHYAWQSEADQMGNTLVKWFDGAFVTGAPQLWPVGQFAESDAYQWLAWAMGELEGPHDAANRSGTDIDPAALDTSLEFLRRRLSNQAHIHGDQFTVTDLNSTAVLLRPQFRAVARSDAHIRDWFNGCVHRPALQRVMAD